MTVPAHVRSKLLEAPISTPAGLVGAASFLALTLGLAAVAADLLEPDWPLSWMHGAAIAGVGLVLVWPANALLKRRFYREAERAAVPRDKAETLYAAGDEEA